MPSLRNTSGTKTLRQVHNFIPEGVLLDTTQQTAYANFWRAANADIFRPTIDLFKILSASKQQHQ